MKIKLKPLNHPQKQKGIISTFVAMMILILMFISAFIFLNYLGVLYKEVKVKQNSQQVLDAAISGLDYAQSIINQNQLINKSQNDDLLYISQLPSTAPKISVKIEIKNLNKNNLNLIDIRSTAETSDGLIKKTTNAQYYNLHSFAPSVERKSSGQYVMVPGSWRDF
ncbi:hypothetical protein L3V82_03785 [Thiotrichales bacterium 19S3-7]|nr:hypothetical protein [Thiotrichales bacterium 19S3-7]MCF6801232.1 hypothetical protein [Thiotrichales bacterium 19S3-11]